MRKFKPEFQSMRIFFLILGGYFVTEARKRGVFLGSRFASVKPLKSFENRPRKRESEEKGVLPRHNLLKLLQMVTEESGVIKNRVSKLYFLGCLAFAV